MGLNNSYLRISARRQGKARGNNEINSVAVQARKDFEIFRKYVCDHESPGHHLRWKDLLITEEDSKCLRRFGGPHTLILSPRGSAKSTFLVELTAWLIGVHTSPEYGIPFKVLYVSYSIEVAMLKSEQIQEIVLSRKYQEVFPHIKPGKKWTTKIWDIDKELALLPRIGEPYTLACAGMKGSVNSKRAHLCLTGETRIATEMGEIPIRSLKCFPEIKILTLNETTNELEWHPLQQIATRFTDEIITVLTDCGRKVCATAEHPFSVGQSQYQEAGDLLPGQKVVVLAQDPEQISRLPWLRDRTGFPERRKDLLGVLPERHESRIHPEVRSLPGRVLSGLQAYCRKIATGFGSFLLQSPVCQSGFSQAQALLRLWHPDWGTQKCQGQTLLRDVSAEPTRFAALKSIRTQKGERVEVYDIQVAQNHNFFANGFLVHNCVFDDLIKSPEQILNATIRERMEANWSNVIRPTMYEGARAICLGTRMDALDIYGTTFIPERGWQVIEESAIIEDDFGNEESYWPEFFSLQHLQNTRDDDVAAFTLQYQNRIPKEGEGIIDPEWLIDGAPPQLEEFDILAVSSDFSSSLRSLADYTVFLLWGVKDDQYWILDMRRGRWNGNIDKADALLTMLIDWNILDCETDFTFDQYSYTVEWDLPEGQLHPRILDRHYFLNFYSDGQSYQSSFKGDWINYVQGKLGVYNISNYPILAKGDKLQRLRGCTGLLQKGQIRFNKYRSFKVLKRELLNFGNTAKDDCVDAFSLGIIGIGVRAKLDY